MSMFNADQRDWMSHLASLPAEAKCRCGWDLVGECYNCNTGDLRRLGLETRLVYGRSDRWFPTETEWLLPDGRWVQYREAVEWLKGQAANPRD